MEDRESSTQSDCSLDVHLHHDQSYASCKQQLETQDAHRQKEEKELVKSILRRPEK